jgi:hypothetical protein
MAFRKDYTLTSGENVDYWSITEYHDNKTYKFVDAVIGCWKTEDDKKVNVLPKVDYRRIRCSAVDYEEYFGIDVQSAEGNNLIKLIYNFAKVKDEFFKDAIDC